MNNLNHIIDRGFVSLSQEYMWTQFDNYIELYDGENILLFDI